MDKILFDCKTPSTKKKVVTTLLSDDSLFDGYLTESTSYQQLPQKNILNGWMIEHPIYAQGGLGKMWQLFGEQTEEIINELNEVLAA